MTVQPIPGGVSPEEQAAFHVAEELQAGLRAFFASRRIMPTECRIQKIYAGLSGQPKPKEENAFILRVEVHRTQQCEDEVIKKCNLFLLCLYDGRILVILKGARSWEFNSRLRLNSVLDKAREALAA